MGLSGWLPVYSFRHLITLFFFINHVTLKYFDTQLKYFIFFLYQQRHKWTQDIVGEIRNNVKQH